MTCDSRRFRQYSNFVMAADSTMYVFLDLIASVLYTLLVQGMLRVLVIILPYMGRYLRKLEL